jgi:hypothetical protein
MVDALSAGIISGVSWLMLHALKGMIKSLFWILPVMAVMVSVKSCAYSTF